MDNSLDQFSKPLQIEKTELATIFSLNYRDSKKGRLFMPIYDARFPYVFKTSYVYVSKFLEKDNTSGNHYHKVKQEILVPLSGNFEFYLEDITTHKKEMFRISDTENKAIYIKTLVSHKIKSLNDTGVLLVLASNPSSMDDEIEYTII